MCLKWNRLRHKSWLVTNGAQDPIVGIVGAGTTTAMTYMNDVVDFKKNVSRPKSKSTSPKTPKSGGSVHEKNNPPKTGLAKRIPIATGKFAGSVVGHTLKGK